MARSERLACTPLHAASERGHGDTETFLAVRFGGEMASNENDNIELTEDMGEPPDALASGSIVGTVNGLIWSDDSGFDVVSVEMQGNHVAVPIETNAWRDATVVELNFSGNMLAGAPRIQDLEAAGGTRAVELVSNHFSMPLAGPPPGPTTGPLPPWWHKETPGGTKQGDDPTPTKA